MLTVLYFSIFCRLRRTRGVRNDRRGPAFRCSPGRVRLTPGGVRAGYGAGGRRRPAGHRSALVTATVPREPTLPGLLGCRCHPRIQNDEGRAWTTSAPGSGHCQRYTLGPAAARWPKFAAAAGGGLRRRCTPSHAGAGAGHRDANLPERLRSPTRPLSCCATTPPTTTTR